MNINLFNFTLFGGAGPGLLSVESIKRNYWSVRQRYDRVRLSISALVRIRLGDQYLLVMGNRVNRYQPVGGVLKYYSSAKSALEGFGLGPDNLYGEDSVNKADLRITIQGKHFAAFLRWYETGRDRETSPWREFHEELVAPGHLDRNLFPHARFNFLRRYTSGLKFSPFAGTPECLISEIHELVPDAPQYDSLETLRKNLISENLLWADAETIRRKGITCKVQAANQIINDNAEWIL